MDFVASASIIRSQLFHLPGADQLTRFIIKSLAGNIIPAVASTNAIVAGLMVLQARHILSKKFEVILLLIPIFRFLVYASIIYG